MEAQRLIDTAPKIIQQAFRAAWNDVEGNFGDDPLTVERARLKLARIMMTMPLDSYTNVTQVKTASLERMALLYREELVSHPSRGYIKGLSDRRAPTPGAQHREARGSPGWQGTTRS